MYYYKLYWDWYEDHEYWLYSHQENRDFENDCILLMRKYGKEYLYQEKSWAQAPHWIEYISSKLPELGYEKIIFEDFGCFGAYIIDKDDTTFHNIIGNDLFRDTLNHNQMIHDDIQR